MGHIHDEDLQKLIAEKRNLILASNTKQISDEEFKIKLEELQLKLDAKIKEHIDRIKGKSTVQTVQTTVEIKDMEETKMADEKPAKEKAVKPKKETNTEVILKILQMKTIKNIPDVIKKFKEKKPAAKDQNVRQQVSEIIGWIKQGKSRFANYVWDAEEFQLTDKTQ